eukprot:CAMPEP_0175786362 /NCGR_PEP_ID=MMETSP0097-20121207/79799_1 /TAXON_ID=311494 /ORGANISM="Alexandrium monilatum, Strain CCMP3105" /LENGTH=144 /DNA_ID=CAMNT_0017097291 /DNA_START=159 /DNA_END=593 /DNA_ORIENTATION=+
MPVDHGREGQEVRLDAPLLDRPQQALGFSSITLLGVRTDQGGAAHDVWAQCLLPQIEQNPTGGIEVPGLGMRLHQGRQTHQARLQLLLQHLCKDLAGSGSVPPLGVCIDQHGVGIELWAEPPALRLHEELLSSSDVALPDSSPD